MEQSGDIAVAGLERQKQGGIKNHKNCSIPPPKKYSLIESPILGIHTLGGAGQAIGQRVLPDPQNLLTVVGPTN